MANLVSKNSLKATTGLNILAGLWLFVSPWVYHASGNPDARNSWIFGALIAIFAAARNLNPSSGRILSVLNMLFGAWTFVSPWVFHYTANTGRFSNSLITGAVILFLGAYGSGSIARTTPRPPQVHT